MRTRTIGWTLTLLAAALGGASAAQELDWARGLGGTSGDLAYGIAVDGAGNVVTVGAFGDTADFDPGPATFELTTLGGVQDAFVSKLDADGDFVWARQLGGTGSSPTARGVAVDGAGNVYVIGDFNATVDFDPGPGVSNLTSTGFVDAFVLKLDANGDFLWAGKLGGGSSELGSAIALDGAGSVHAVGRFEGTADFDPGAGVANLTSFGISDAFVVKLDTDGNFLWTRQLGGTSAEDARSVAVDGSGNVHTFGIFQLTADFDPGSGTANLTSAGNLDAFVSKLDSGGNFVWARRLGGFSIDEALGLALDGAGNVHTVGYFAGTGDFDPGMGVVNLSSAGSADVFVSKLDSDGDFVFARRLGGTDYDAAFAVTVGNNGHVYTVGRFEGTADFDPGVGAVDLTAAGNQADAFISELDATGDFVGVRVFTGAGFEEILAVATGSGGALYPAGRFNGTPNFDPGPGLAELDSAGSTDAFAVKLAGSGPAAPDIFEVEIETNAAEAAGVTPNYAFGIGMTADASLSDVTVTPPGGGLPFPLLYDPLDDVWSAWFEGYASLAALRADYPLGNYLLEFNAGIASVLLDYPELEPDCFAETTFPTEECVVSPTPTLSWTLPAGCSAGAVDVGLEVASDESEVFGLAFIPAAAGSIAVPDGPVSPTPVEPLPPLAPLTVGESYRLGIDVVEGRFTNESADGDGFDYFASFRNDLDTEFTVSDQEPIVVLEIDGTSLVWSCSGGGTNGFDVVRGDLGTLRASEGNFAVGTLDCVADDHPDTTIGNADAPGAGQGFWYLVREAAAGGNGSYSAGGASEQPGRDAGIATSGLDCF